MNLMQPLHFFRVHDRWIHHVQGWVVELSMVEYVVHSMSSFRNTKNLTISNFQFWFLLFSELSPFYYGLLFLLDLLSRRQVGCRDISGRCCSGQGQRTARCERIQIAISFCETLIEPWSVWYAIYRSRMGLVLSRANKVSCGLGTISSP